MKDRLPILLMLTALLPTLLAGTVGTALCADQAPNRELVMFIAYADVPPYFFDTPDSRGTGILPDVLRAVLRPLGYRFTTRQLPDKRGWEMLANGDLDVYASAREWVETPGRFLWTDPFMGSEDILLYRAESTLRYTRPEDLYGKAVAGIKGFVYPALEGHFRPDGIIRLDATSPDAMLKALTMGRADAILINHTEIQLMFRNRKDLDPAAFRIDETPMGHADFRFLFPGNPKWEPLVRQINARLETMKRDGSLEAVLDRYR